MVMWFAGTISAAAGVAGDQIDSSPRVRQILPIRTTTRERAMADLVREHGVLTQDFTHIEAADFGLADVQFVDQHFIDPRGRTVRMRSFYRLLPGEVHYRNKRKGGDDAPRV